MDNAPAAGPDLSAIKIPLLISGIFNAISALSLLIAGLVTLIAFIGCFILPFAAGAGVLAYFEIKTYMELDKTDNPAALKSRVQLIAILEICTIIFSNIPSVVCGVISLVNLNKLDEHAA